MRRRAGAVWRWLGGHQFIAALILIGGFVVAGFWRDQVLAGHERDRTAQDRAFVACMADWAQDVTDRGAIVAAGRRDIDNAADALWRTFATLLAAPPPDARQRFQGYLNDYVTASNDYRQILRDNPVPAPPRIRC